jgi:hypothetical protein
MFKEKKISPDISGLGEEDIMRSLEISSLPDWPRLLKKFKKRFYGQKKFSKSFSSETYLRKNGRLMLEFFFLVTVGYLLVVGTRELNLFYEKKILDKINIFDFHDRTPQTSLSMGKENIDNINGPLNPPQKNLDELVEKEKKLEKEMKLEKDVNLDTESEVILTSWKTLPKDFKSASLQLSNYEEESNNAGRDTAYGNKKIYRVIMESINPLKAKEAVDSFLAKYKGIQVDSVRPGTYVPGGLYYNVLIPQEKLQPFLSSVMETEESTLYETRTRLENPPGKGRVFIWIKAF